MSHNPLIDYPDLPPFSDIRPEHVQPAVDALVAAGRERIREVLAKGDFSYRALEQTLAEEDDRLGKAFGPVGHLNAVAQNEALREAYNACLPLLSEYGTEVGQNEALFAAYQALRDSDEEAARQVMRDHAKVKEFTDRMLEEAMEAEGREAIVYAVASRYMRRVSGHLSNVATAVINPVDQLAGKEAPA